MDIKLYLQTLTLKDMQVNAIIFLPTATTKVRPALGIFTHGYTSHKGSIINWGHRLAEYGIPSILFDLPGHYLGSYSEVNDFEDFKNLSPQLFYLGYRALLQKIEEFLPLENHFFENDQSTLLMGGHSLGALLSLKAMELPEFKSCKKINFSIGLGMSFAQGKAQHLFETDFYQKTLNFRKQLVSPQLDPSLVFPWIKSEKENLEVREQIIYLITGEDDVVVPKNNAIALKDRLVGLSNNVTLIMPGRLPHHNPELASGHIFSLVKKLIPN